MSSPPDPAALQRRLERERQRRLEAENIAEDATRHLYTSNAELQRLNEQLDAVNEELRSVIYTVSHDMRNPIVTLLGYLELWAEDEELVLREEHQRDLQVMIDKGRYVRALTQDLLEVSRIGRLEDDPEDVAVADIAAVIARELRRDHDQVTVEVGALPVIRAVPLRLRQLLANLAGNAVTHSGRPDVTVRMTSRELPRGAVEIEVSDDGRGIPPEEREEVFKLFHRADHRREAESTGIGLTICRKITHALGGTIVVGDRSPGASFLITLPADVVVRPPASAPAVETTSA